MNKQQALDKIEELKQFVEQCEECEKNKVEIFYKGVWVEENDRFNKLNINDPSIVEIRADAFDYQSDWRDYKYYAPLANTSGICWFRRVKK